MSGTNWRFHGLALKSSSRHMVQGAVRKKLKPQPKPVAHLDGAMALFGGGPGVASYEMADVRQRTGDVIARATKGQKIEARPKDKPAR